MKLIYDKEVDIVKVIFSDAIITESDEEKKGVIIDYDEKGNVVSIEILNASSRMENPLNFQYEIAAA